MRTCFIIMPFGSEHDSTYSAYEHACKISGYQCKRADTSLGGRAIMTDIVQDILQADVVLADLTGMNSNVLYELGLAHASCKTVILTASSKTLSRRLPFDIAAYRVHTYKSGDAGTKAIIEVVAETLKQAAVRQSDFSSPYVDAVSHCTNKCASGSLVINTWRVALEGLNGAMIDIFAHYSRIEAAILDRAAAATSKPELLRIAQIEHELAGNPQIPRSTKREQMPLDVTITVIDSKRFFIFHPSKQGEAVESGHPFHTLFDNPDGIIYWQNRYSSEGLDNLEIIIPRRNTRMTRLAGRHVNRAKAFIIVESHLNLIHTIPWKNEAPPSQVN